MESLWNGFTELSVPVHQRLPPTSSCQLPGVKNVLDGPRTSEIIILTWYRPTLHSFTDVAENNTRTDYEELAATPGES